MQKLKRNFWFGSLVCQLRVDAQPTSPTPLYPHPLLTPMQETPVGLESFYWLQKAEIVPYGYHTAYHMVTIWASDDSPATFTVVFFGYKWYC